jgi:hypothetical protein
MPTFAPRRLAAALVLTLTAGLAAPAAAQPLPASSAPAPAATPVDRARAVLGPFKASLKATLTSALAQGPVAAIEACAVSAPGLAAAAAHDGVTVGRSAVKLRNPVNAPPAWVVAPMAELAAAPPKEGDHRVVALPDGGTGYVETILVGEPCVKCHGAEAAVSPEVRGLLKQRYPADQATGFAQGQFRGVFWAQVAPTGK